MQWLWGERFRQFLLVATGLILTSCASYTQETRSARALFETGDYERAATLYKRDAEEPGKDQVLGLLDYSTSLYLAHDFEKSRSSLDFVEQLMEYKDYTSLEHEAMSLLTSAQSEVYQGEDFEKLMVNVIWAIGYLEEHNWEEALVECRKMDYKLYRMKEEGKRPWNQLPIARYLSALAWETAGDWDNAYIDYKKALELVPEFPLLREDLIRLARLAGRGGERKKWEGEFHLKGEAKRYSRPLRSSQEGEIILIYENGLAPAKVPSPVSYRIPVFSPIPKRYRQAVLMAKPAAALKEEKEPVLLASDSTSQKDESSENNLETGITVKLVTAEPKKEAKADTSYSYHRKTELLFNLEETAIQQLKTKMATIVGKRVGGVILKEVISNQVEKKTNSPVLGGLTRLALHLSDQADTRSWRTLPAEYQIARLRVPKGEYQIAVQKIDSFGGIDSPAPLSGSFKIEAGKRYYFVHRGI